MNNKFSIKKILILVSLLAVPGFLYYLLTEKGQNRYRPLDIFGPKQVASTFHTKHGKKIPDTLYHTIRDFKLVSNTGDSIGIPTDSNQITVVNFFFTNCNTFCKEMNRQMARVVAEYPNNKRLKFYSISVDPERDSPSVLNVYAKTYKAKPVRWSFLTGNKAFIFELARKDFLVDAYSGSSADSIVHSPLLILIDADKRIRGYYDSTSKEQVDKLIDEIKVQITEELRKATALKPIK
ncbi:SCO family protein [Pedobacter sp. P351]|uniref:SCO family protein n=1 Tax=Pedobacter superstes TaxID=3133441 RepID=UPI0030960C51